MRQYEWYFRALVTGVIYADSEEQARNEIVQLLDGTDSDCDIEEITRKDLLDAPNDNPKD